MKEWYYSEFGQTKGPVSLDAVVQLILKQELELEAYVTDGMDKPWRKIKDIPVIMDKVHQPQDLPHASEIPANFISEDGEVRIGNLYFYIPIKRFILMTIVTFGLYQFYWFYKQWQYFDRKDRLAYQRSRGFFEMLFFPFRIFQNIQYDKEMNAVIKADFSGMGIFWLWLGAGVALYLLLSTALGSQHAYGSLGYAFLSLDVLVLIPIQRYVNRVNEKLGNTYDKPSLGHYLCLGVAVLTVAMLIIGSGIRALLGSVN
jgi:uncharacterized membrane protein YiaA